MIRVFARSCLRLNLQELVWEEPDIEDSVSLWDFAGVAVVVLMGL